MTNFSRSQSHYLVPVLHCFRFALTVELFRVWKVEVTRFPIHIVMIRACAEAVPDVIHHPTLP